MTINLTLSDRQVQCLWRALIDYEKALMLSGIRNPELVEEELHLTRQFQETLSLESFFPETVYSTETETNG